MIEIVKLNARLDQLDENGQTARAFVEKRARKGDARSIAMLRAASDVPACLEYLHRRFLRLHGMRRIDGMNGKQRLSPSEILDGAELFGWSLSPLEADAIVAMDIAALYPGDEET